LVVLRLQAKLIDDHFGGASEQSLVFVDIAIVVLFGFLPEVDQVVSLDFLCQLFLQFLLEHGELLL